MRNYLSLILLFVPAVLFGVLLYIFREKAQLALSNVLPYFPWQFYAITFFGTIATIGGVLDWS